MTGDDNDGPASRSDGPASRSDGQVSIANRDRHAGTPARELALSCLEAGIDAAIPERIISASISLAGDTLHVADAQYDLAQYDSIRVLGGGNAAGRVAAELEAVLGDRISGGIVVTDDPVETETVSVIEGSHPTPDRPAQEGARRMHAVARASAEQTLLLVVVTGGASALLPSPAGDLTLADLQSLTDALVESGAPIQEINTVRKHVSNLKGGQFAATAAPATVVGLIFSDVVGNDLSVVASGPTTPDETTYADAIAVLDRYEIDAPAVYSHLQAGVAGDHPETPGPDDDAWEFVDNHLLASNWTSLQAAADHAREADYEAIVLSSRVRGEATHAAPTHIAVAEEVKVTDTPVEAPAVVLSGGETTVTVTGDGDGGPNQEFALAAALELATGDVFDGDDVALAAVDTDGRDGASDYAGALVDAGTVAEPDEARDALTNNDAGSYLGDAGSLLETGRTGTNVDDLRVIVVEGKSPDRANGE